MSILEERKALEDGFDRLQRIYKEWQRNPSALVRDSLKKYLIDCYDHLLKLDRIDIDSDKFEESIMANSREESSAKVEDHHIASMEGVETEVIENEVLSEVSKEEVVDEVNVEEIVNEKEIVEEEAAEENTPLFELDETEEIIEVANEEGVNEEVKEKDSPPEISPEKELNPSEVYLSGSEEREIEEFFKDNFSQSEIDETAVKNAAKVAEIESTDDSEAIVPEEKLVETPEAELEEEVATVESVEETEVEEEEKSRWSSFFSKEEPKPFEEPQVKESQQLTLADKLSITKEEVGVHYELKEQAITDLNAAIPIAKKFEFIRELFGDDSTNYKTAVSSINEAGELQKALDISENLAETYNWSNKEKLAEEFNTILKRRFSEE